MTIALGDAEFIVAANSGVTIPLDVVPALPFELTAHLSSGREVARYRVRGRGVPSSSRSDLWGPERAVRPGPA